MFLNFRHINEGKTEIIVFESSDIACSSGINLGHLSSCVKPVVKNLGVYFYSALKFDKRIRTVVKTIYFSISDS